MIAALTGSCSGSGGTAAWSLASLAGRRGFSALAQGTPAAEKPWGAWGRPEAPRGGAPAAST